MKIIPPTYSSNKGRGKKSTFTDQQADMIKAVFKKQIEGTDRITPTIVEEKIKNIKLLRNCDSIKLCGNIRYDRLNFRKGVKND